MNPFDENAVEEAVRLKEAGLATEVIAVSIGPQKAQETLRTALAIGADRAILVKTDLAVEPLGVAKILQAIAAKERPNLIILGKQAIDDDNNQTGQMLAALLGWPQGTFASKVVVEAGEVRVTREIDGGQQTIRLNLPAVITTDLLLNEPRYVSVLNAVKAKQKPMAEIDPATLGVALEPRLKILRTEEEPPARKTAQIVKNVVELVQKLREEAGVI
jgi:electron transfer flavoprotein beta subunit